ncbi:hypothetical protein L3V82_09920 [Thiotrichales bacterium 19S3-7]|nr:hypothetical protein [Thiotrichales bacterium 19S3-7]MCF6802475.1 hypothetical protein [Thiotrichales bacterium 19S3-11]
MKKVIALSSITGVCLLTSISAFAANQPAKSGLTISGQGSFNFTPNQTFNATSNNTNDASNISTSNGGFGGALFLGYNYAITPNITIGTKVGYQYIYQVNQFKASYNLPGFNNANDQVNVNNIPLLFTANYYFNSGWLVGIEGGIDFQKWTLKQTGDSNYIYNNMGDQHNFSSQWNTAPMAGLSFGYQWQSSIALTASADYIFGNKTSDITSVNTNQPLALYNIGLNLSYTF